MKVAVGSFDDLRQFVMLQIMPTVSVRSLELGLNLFGRNLAALGGMNEPSAKRRRTLALHDRALRFSAAVNACCPIQFSTFPSKVVWEQLVRAADSSSNNLIEADGASSDADFLSKMGIALREAKESRAALVKLRLGNLENYQLAANRNLESEADQLAAIFARIILNMRARLEGERRSGAKNPQRRTDH